MRQSYYRALALMMTIPLHSAYKSGVLRTLPRRRRNRRNYSWLL